MKSVAKRIRIFDLTENIVLAPFGLKIWVQAFLDLEIQKT